MKLGEFSETANRDACRMEHAISEESYLKIQQLVKSDNGVLGKLIWEGRQYSRAPIIVVIPGSHVVKKYIDWGADLVLCTQTAEKTGEIRSRNSQADSEYQEGGILSGYRFTLDGI